MYNPKRPLYDKDVSPDLDATMNSTGQGDAKKPKWLSAKKIAKFDHVKPGGKEMIKARWFIKGEKGFSYPLAQGRNSHFLQKSRKLLLSSTKRFNEVSNWPTNRHSPSKDK